MSAQPVHHNDPQDPQVIFQELPERERRQFLRQYRQAVEAARDDLARYHDLTLLLHRWSLVVIAANRPGYYQAITDAKNGTGETVPLAQALDAELARRR
jgi:ribosomal protein L18